MTSGRECWLKICGKREYFGVLHLNLCRERPTKKEGLGRGKHAGPLPRWSHVASSQGGPMSVLARPKGKNFTRSVHKTLAG